MEKDKYKVGDWVFCHIIGHYAYNHTSHPVKILRIVGDDFYYDKGSNSKLGYKKGLISNSCYSFNQILRYAAYNEIPNSIVNYEIY